MGTNLYFTVIVLLTYGIQSDGKGQTRSKDAYS
jgi:hypothetical protein